jgi:hypothetical protein
MDVMGGPRFNWMSLPAEKGLDSDWLKRIGTTENVLFSFASSIKKDNYHFISFILQ